jgi:hypothetical protein
MITILSEKMVKIRKRRCCFACGRVYEIGSRMNVQTNVSDDCDNVAHIYTCPTCNRLIARFPEFFFDDDGYYWDLCVHEYLTDHPEHAGKTPEQLLEYFRETIGDNLKYENDEKSN